MAFVPLIVAGGIAAYSIQQAQANLDSKNLWKNSVDGKNYSAETGITFDPNSKKRVAQSVKDWQDVGNKHPLPLNTIDTINFKIQEIATRTKIKRKSVPTIPGLTKMNLPYTDFGLANNPSKF